MNFEDLKDKVLRWADDMNLIHSENANMQFMKFIEEIFEFKSEFDMWSWYKKFDFDESVEGYLSNNNINKCKNMKLEMGDIFVALIILCEQIGIDPMECLSVAYEKMQGGFSRDE